MNNSKEVVEGNICHLAEVFFQSLINLEKTMNIKMYDMNTTVKCKDGRTLKIFLKAESPARTWENYMTEGTEVSTPAVVTPKKKVAKKAVKKVAKKSAKKVAKKKVAKKVTKKTKSKK